QSSCALFAKICIIRARDLHAQHICVYNERVCIRCGKCSCMDASSSGAFCTPRYVLSRIRLLCTSDTSQQAKTGASRGYVSMELFQSAKQSIVTTERHTELLEVISVWDLRKCMPHTRTLYDKTKRTCDVHVPRRQKLGIIGNGAASSTRTSTVASSRISSCKHTIIVVTQLLRYWCNSTLGSNNECVHTYPNVWLFLCTDISERDAKTICGRCNVSTNSTISDWRSFGTDDEKIYPYGINVRNEFNSTRHLFLCICDILHFICSFLCNKVLSWRRTQYKSESLLKELFVNTFYFTLKTEVFLSSVVTDLTQISASFILLMSQNQPFSTKRGKGMFKNLLVLQKYPLT
uniref:Uncharacterized protein n=1 Tax=Parascaris univalens TaxID=6257 RepID=A0A914ZQT1_PARUN